MRYEFSAADCDVWKKDPTRHPTTKRKLRSGKKGQLYQLMRQCNKKTPNKQSKQHLDQMLSKTASVVVKKKKPPSKKASSKKKSSAESSINNSSVTPLSSAEISRIIKSLKPEPRRKNATQKGSNNRPSEDNVGQFFEVITSILNERLVRLAKKARQANMDPQFQKEIRDFRRIVAARDIASLMGKKMEVSDAQRARDEKLFNMYGRMEPKIAESVFAANRIKRKVPGV